MNVFVLLNTKEEMTVTSSLVNSSELSVNE